MVKICKR